MLKNACTSLKKKLAGRSGQAGETLVEVLVAMTVAGLSMIMLAMAIAVSSNIVTQSAEAADDYYATSANMATLSSGTATGNITVAMNGETPGTSVSVKYYKNDNMPGGGSAVSYEATTLAPTP